MSDDQGTYPTAEHARLAEEAARTANWKRWGPFLSERQWGTVREDYSPDGACWEHFPFEHAHLRVYRWGEDGLLGWTDRECRLCFGLALWNGQDEILKERLYGLTGPQGNHGEDVKEKYWYLDATPTHGYNAAAYHYPHAAYPYEKLLAENNKLSREDDEYEIEDTGVFDDGKYFDVVAEYAKDTADDVLVRVTVTNCASDGDPKTIHVLPQLWFRNTWMWGCEHEGCTIKPWMWSEGTGTGEPPSTIRADHQTLGKFTFHLGVGPDGRQPELLFTENLANTKALYNDKEPAPYTKDAFGRYLINKEKAAVNRAMRGTKAAAVYKFTLGPGESQTIRIRFRNDELPAMTSAEALGENYDAVFAQRKQEADAFYRHVLPDGLDDEQRLVSRQAYAGLAWCKQFYHYIVQAWLDGDPLMPTPPAKRKEGRNGEWRHFFARDILSMPDKWEYPWFAAWDSAFHMIPYSRIDPYFAKRQMEKFLREWYMHPNGQIPAYEFAFEDVNPPVHAWAVWRIYKMTAPRGQRDRAFLASCFQKLLLNFTWWVNRKDPQGNNVFGGGFLGLDNIGVFDRSQPLPGGHTLTQSDGTAWMAFYSATMLGMAIELADGDHPESRAYADMASKFFEHFVHIADAANHLGGSGLWDPEDGFYYDHLVIDGKSEPLRVQSLVGLMPIVAVETFNRERINRIPGFRKRLDWFLQHRTDLARTITYMVDDESADATSERVHGNRFLLALPSRARLEKVLSHMFAEDEFYGPYGIRSMSKKHEADPYEVQIGKQHYVVEYAPAESRTAMFGGNSNWRGPVWFPMNYLIIEALQRYHHFYGDSFKVEVPTGSGNWMNLMDASRALAQRLTRLCVPDENGRTLFYEYFHGDTGRGCGASHQTGWTSLVTRCIEEVAAGASVWNPDESMAGVASP
ncbi:MAG: glucosidase [Planctomycetota bacterium]